MIQTHTWPQRVGWMMRCGLICALATMGNAVVRAATPEQFAAWGDEAKADPYLVNALPDTPVAPAITTTIQEKARGLIAFARPLLAIVPPDEPPAPTERCAELKAQDCRGQYGAVSFSVMALETMTVSVRVTALNGPDANTIPADHLQVREVRPVKMISNGKAQATPLTLESSSHVLIPRGRMRQFWIAYFVPTRARPGMYSGTIEVLADKTVRLAIPLHIKVHNFDLVESPAHFYMYDQTPDTAAEAYQHWMDQRCHGMNMGMLTPPMDYQANDIKRRELLSLLDAYRQVGFPTKMVYIDLWNRIISEWINTPDKSIGMWGPWFRYYPFSDALDAKYLRAVRYIDEQAKARGLRVMLAVADEAGSHPWTIQAARHYNALLKEHLPDITREMTCGGGWATGQPEDQLWKGLIDIWSTNRWLPDRLDIVKRENPSAKIAIYNMAGGGSGPGGLGAARAMYGFFAWKAKADGVAQWVYSFNGQPTLTYTWPAKDENQGMVPTLRWEAIREGTKDRRYLATLEDLIAKHPGRTADQATRFLDDIGARIPLRNVDYDPINGGRIFAQAPQVYDQWREEITRWIERLREEP